MNIHQHLGSADPTKVAKATYGALMLIQEQSPAEQIMAASLLAKLMADAYGLSLWDVQSYVTNLLADSEAMRLPEFKALHTYIAKEVRQHVV